MKRCDLCGTDCPDGAAQCECGSYVFTSDGWPGAAPAPAAAQRTGLRAWYCDAARYRRLFRFASATDRGVLGASEGRVRFWGGSHQLDLGPIVRVSLTALHWPTLASMALGIGLVVLASFLGLTSFFTPDNGWTYVVLLPFTLYWLAVFPLRWVEVEHIDDRGRKSHAYFAGGELLGNNFKGTKRIAEMIERTAMGRR